MESFKIFFKHRFFMLEDKIEARLRRVKAKENPLKKVISSMSNWYKKLWKFITWQPQMLFKWNLPELFIFIRFLSYETLRA